VNYLVDTNPVSEFTKPRPNLRVIAWLQAHDLEFYISTVTIAEIRRGIERIPLGNKKIHLHSWLINLCKQRKGRILSFDSSVAHVWGQIAAKWESSGLSVAPFGDSE